MIKVIAFIFWCVVGYLLTFIDFTVTKNSLQMVMVINGLFLFMSILCRPYNEMGLRLNVGIFFANALLFLYALNVDNSLMKLSAVYCFFNMLNSIDLSHDFLSSLNINKSLF